MKQLLILISFILISFNGLAQSSPMSVSAEYTSKLKGEEIVSQENIVAIGDLKNKLELLEDSMTKFKICEAKYLVFIGYELKYTDSDGCIDVKDVKAPDESKRPSFAGFLSAIRKGNLTTESEIFDTGNSAQTWGRLRADSLCETAFDGSRAMTYDDLKYMIYAIPRLGDTFSALVPDSHIWLFDATGIYETAGVTSFSKNYQKDVGHCEGWLDATSSNKGTVLEITGTTTRYLNISGHQCNSYALISCVYN
ncbi:MAG: hypothetical protein GY793_06900 [Proteobacteria bacterium]|nr:hypothetical protein [Pseudomonadota bacterium]